MSWNPQISQLLVSLLQLHSLFFIFKFSSIFISQPAANERCAALVPSESQDQRWFEAGKQHEGGRVCLNPDLKTQICSSSQLAGVCLIKAKWHFCYFEANQPFLLCHQFREAVFVAGFVNSALLHFSQAHLICTTQQFPSNLPPSTPQFLHLHFQSFRRLQRVLPCKAANHLLTGPLIIADFIPQSVCWSVIVSFIHNMSSACCWAC